MVRVLKLVFVPPVLQQHADLVRGVHGRGVQEGGVLDVWRCDCCVVSVVSDNPSPAGGDGSSGVHRTAVLCSLHTHAEVRVQCGSER